MVKLKDQIITDKYCLYNGDACEVSKGMPDNSVGLCIHSPPFADLYSYSDTDEDMSNCGSYADFFKHYKYLSDELFRVMMPGRICCVHTMDLPAFKNKGEEIGLKDFSGDIIRLFQKSGFIFHSRHCIWKDPLIAATRTKAIGLAHKQIVKDSALCRTGIPDYLLAFRKPGDNPKPISHPKGLTSYYGEKSIPKHLDSAIALHRELHGEPTEENPYDPAKDKRSHWIWQQYASPVWMDIRQTRVLPYRAAREEDDERHICPLQTDVIERCVELWSTKGDVVFSPFAGVGSEVYVAVKNKRKGIGIELKSRYFRQAVKNVQAAIEAQKGFKE